MLHMKRMKKERQFVEQAILDGEISRAEWSNGGETLKTEHDVGGPFGEIEVETIFPQNYPVHPPTMRVLSRVVHPNVYSSKCQLATMQGSVCMTILDVTPGVGNAASEKWTPNITLPALLRSLTVVMLDPCLESPADLEANCLFMRNKEEYIRQNELQKKLRADRKVKAEQDFQFLEAEKADAFKSNEEVSRLRKEEDIKAKVTDAKNMLPLEPPADCGKSLANIRFRTSTETFTRRFLASDTLESVFLFLSAKGYSSLEFKVLTFPRKLLTDHHLSSTLADLQLCPQALIIVEAETSLSD